jgi:hypothetical protein
VHLLACRVDLGCADIPEHGVLGNVDRMDAFGKHMSRVRPHAIRRRVRRERMSWTRFSVPVDRYLTRARVFNLYPHQRFAS